MDTLASLNHSVWDCKYHVVFIPKCRRKVLYGQLRKHLVEVFRALAKQKESRIEEGHLLADHVHMLIAIPPKYAVAQVVGFIKGKSAIHLARVYGERKRNLWASISGRGDTSCRRSGVTRPSSASTSSGRRRRTPAWTNWRCGDDGHRQVAPNGGVALATPSCRFERLTFVMPPALPGDAYSRVSRPGLADHRR